MQRNSGICETTSTQRLFIENCTCGTYPDNLGPCFTFEVGENGRCPYCDHDEECHKKAIKLLDDTYNQVMAGKDNGRRY